MKILFCSILSLTFLSGCLLHPAGDNKYSGIPFLESFKGENKRVLGRYEGILIRNDGREDQLDMRLSENDGESFIKLTDPKGKVYMKRAGLFSNHLVKKAPEENSFFVEVDPDDSYFWINFKLYPQASGKYFEKGEEKGKLQLRKRDPSESL